MKTSTPSFLLAALTAVLLSACGGGDDGDAPPPAPVAISGANQAGVARATVAGVLSIGFSESGATPLAGAASVRGRAAALGRRAMHALAGGKRRPAIVGTDTESCEVSGSVTARVGDNDNNGATSVGDTLVLTFANCVDSDGVAINGVLSSTVIAVSGAEQVTASVSFQHVSVDEDGLSSEIDGAATITETDGTTEDDTVIVVGPGGLAVDTSTPSYSDTIVLDEGMRIESTEVFADGDSLLTMDGTFSAASIGGSVEVQTVQPFVLADGAEFPEAGQLRVIGANGSQLLVTAVSATDASLQLDAGGDGVFESTTAVAWSVLIPQ
jgi:hypothetical protein